MERTAYILYLFVLVVSPLLFGAVDAYAYTLVFLAIFAAGLLLIAGNIKKDFRSNTYQYRYLKTDLNPLWYCFIVFLFLQIIPLPEAMVQLLSLESHSIIENSKFKIQNSAPSVFHLSPYTYPVRMSLVRWLAYGVFFIGFFQTLNSRKRIEIAIACILITAVFDSVYGIFQTYTGSHKIWWVAKHYGRDVSGTFINRNHFAGYMEMAVILATCYAAALVRGGGRRKSKPRHKTLKARLSGFLALEQSLSKRGLIIFAGMVTGLGLLLSASRGGIVSVAAGLLLLGIIFLLRKSHRRQGVYALIVFVLIAAYGLHIGIDHTLKRFEFFDTAKEARELISRETMNIFQDYRVIGAGLGNFQYVFPRYQSAQLERKTYVFAHNDYAQLLAEGGLLGFGLFLAGGVFFLIKYIRRWRERYDPYAVAIGAAPLAILFAMAMHSYGEFNLHIPANFLTFAGILAIGSGALHVKKRRAGEKTTHAFRSLPLRSKGLLVLAISCGLVLWAGTWTVRHFIGEANCSTAIGSSLDRDSDPPIEEIESATAWNPGNAQYWYKLARKQAKVREQALADLDIEPAEKSKAIMAAVNSYETAIRGNPLLTHYYMFLGWEYSRLWFDKANREKWLAAADHAMERAAWFSGEKNSLQHLFMGNYWLRRSRSLKPADGTWDMALDKAGFHYQKVLTLEKGGRRKNSLERITKLVWDYYPSETMLNRLGIEK